MDLSLGCCRPTSKASRGERLEARVPQAEVGANLPVTLLTPGLCFLCDGREAPTRAIDSHRPDERGVRHPASAVKRDAPTWEVWHGCR